MRGGPTMSQIAPTCVRGGTAAGLGTIGIATPACVGRRQVRGCPSGARRPADSVLVVVGSEDEAVALLQAGARWAGFIPVTWYRAGREPELDRDSAGSSDWSPVRDRQCCVLAARTR